MGADARTGVTPERTDGSGLGADAPPARPLLAGVLVGPFYLVVGLVQALLREGFDLARHPLSVLANGPGGWVQTANFVLSGALVIAAAIGLRGLLGPPARMTGWLLIGFGASMLVAAVFPADPVDGFPVGTPKGPPTSISSTGLTHFIAGALGFTCLGASALAAARALSRAGESSLARLSLGSGIVVLAGFFAGPVLSSVVPLTLGIWISVVVGWALSMTVSNCTEITGEIVHSG